jgi:hypothetical protein
MAQVQRDGEASASTVDLERSLLEQQLDAMERPAGRSHGAVLAWFLVIVGLLAIVSLGIHGYSAYTTVARINVTARIETLDPLLMFQDVATNGPRIGTTVENSSRSTYTRALEQFVLDGTGIAIGVALLVGGLFVRANQ